jgi:hypothetical protein
MKNRGEFFKGNEKKFFIIGLIPFLIVFLGVIIYTHINRDREFTKSVLNTSFSFKVDSLFYDRSNHGAITIITTSKDIVGNNFGAIKGDSLCKKSNDSIVYIYRKDSIIKFNYIQMYRDYGWLD